MYMQFTSGKFSKSLLTSFFALSSLSSVSQTEITSPPYEAILSEKLSTFDLWIAISSEPVKTAARIFLFVVQAKKSAASFPERGASTVISQMLFGLFTPPPTRKTGRFVFSVARRMVLLMAAMEEQTMIRSAEISLTHVHISSVVVFSVIKKKRPFTLHSESAAISFSIPHLSSEKYSCQLRGRIIARVMFFLARDCAAEFTT